MSMNLRVVILAAGMGTRLSRPLPKPLTELSDGRSILQQQMDNIYSSFGGDVRIMVVVGFKFQSIMEAFPDATFIYNELYDQTNTAKSLLKALKSSEDGGVLWLNGDVVFDPEVLERVKPFIRADESFAVVNNAQVGDEEIKYTVDEEGYVIQISKVVMEGLGEAVGINFVSSQDKFNLIERLKEVDDQAYFERALELSISEDGLRLGTIDISDLKAIEIDFQEDLDRANQIFRN
jgi:choline kinase